MGDFSQGTVICLAVLTPDFALIINKLIKLDNSSSSPTFVMHVQRKMWMKLDFGGFSEGYNLLAQH